MAQEVKLPLLVPMADHVNDHGACQNQHVVFALGNLHAIGVRPGKPPLSIFPEQPGDNSRQNQGDTQGQAYSSIGHLPVNETGERNTRQQANTEAPCAGNVDQVQNDIQEKFSQIADRTDLRSSAQA
jgi:hypothetical protein